MIFQEMYICGVQILIAPFKSLPMKKLLLAFCCPFYLAAVAQPVIPDASRLPQPGYTDPVSMATPPSASAVSAAGPNQTWDFSSYSYTSLGNMTVIDPASSPMAASFPNADYAYTLVGTTSFFQVSPGKFEVLAYSITSPGSGNDYSQNPRTILKLPFNFQESVTDTWQKAGGSVNNVTVTYDAYGTLITPTGTYSNVVRIKEDYGAGAIDYQWFLTDPLSPVMVYDHNNNRLIFVGASANAISETSRPNQVTIFPNPGKDFVMLKIGYTVELATVRIFNSQSQLVKEITATGNEVQIEVQGLPAGIYSCQVLNNNSMITAIKLAVE